MAVLAQSLRESVLEAALQGKLTERLVSDSSIDKLIEQMKNKKDELIKNKIILKKAPTEPFYNEDNYPFEIPDTWKWVQLSDVSIIQEGAGIRKHQYTTEGIQLLCVTNILNTTIDLNLKKIYVSEKEYKEKYTHLTPQIGDLITACSGGSYGKVTFYNQSDTVMLNTSVLRMRFFDDLSNNKFLYYIAKSSFFKTQLDAQLVGIQPNFGYAHYSRITFPLPPIEEQNRIVDKLENIMSKIDEYEKIEKRLEEIKKQFSIDLRDSLLQAAMQGKLTEQLPTDSSVDNLLDKIKEEREKLEKEGKIKKTSQKSALANSLILNKEEFPFDIPDNWRMIKHNCIFEIQGGSQPEKSKFHDKKEADDVRLYQIRDYGPNPVPIYVNKKLVTKFTNDGDILLARYGASIGKVFRAKDGAYNVAMAKVIPQNIEINLDFLYYFYLSPIYQNFILNVSASRSAQAGFNKDDLNDLFFPLPPIEEQKRIVEQLDKLLPLCEIL